jgi:hypothetical protein
MILVDDSSTDFDDVINIKIDMISKYPSVVP